MLKDLPSNTNLTTEIYASSRSAYSALAVQDGLASAELGRGGNTYTFVRLQAQDVTTADLQSKPGYRHEAGKTPRPKRCSRGSRPAPASPSTPCPCRRRTSRPIRPDGGQRQAGWQRGAIGYGIAVVGALIVRVAAINFVTLMTARAARRGIEVGIRKATGAQRADLMVQVVGEALLQGRRLRPARDPARAAEVLLPPFNAFIQRSLSLNFLADPALLPGRGSRSSALVVGLLAGAYPALVLSSFRPALVLKGGVTQASGSPIARSSLVVGAVRHPGGSDRDHRDRLSADAVRPVAGPGQRWTAS